MGVSDGSEVIRVVESRSESRVTIVFHGGLRRTGIHLTTKAKNRLANAGAHDRAVLCLVVDHLLLATLDVVALRLTPRARESREGLELVA